MSKNIKILGYSAMNAEDASFDASQCLWDSVEEFENFCEDFLDAIPEGMTIKVRDGKDIVEYEYKLYGGGVGHFVRKQTRALILFGGVVETSIVLQGATPVAFYAKNQSVVWASKLGRFCVNYNGKFYTSSLNSVEWFGEDGKPYDRALYMSNGKLYALNGESLVEIGVAGTGGAGVGLDQYDETAAKSIEIRMVNGVKSLALLNKKKDVMSSIALEELGLAMPTIDAPVIVVEKNQCAITTTTDEAKIYWEYEADPVVGRSNLYTKPFEIDFGIEDEIEIRAVVTKNGVTSAVSTVTAERAILVATPVIAQVDNTITITCYTPNSVIYYTTDGSTPSATNGFVYKGGVGLTASCTVNAIAIANGKSSKVATLEFVHGGEEETSDVVAAPFVVATWNVGRWSTDGTSFYTKFTTDDEANAAAAKARAVFAKINAPYAVPDVLLTQETNEELRRYYSKSADARVFVDFANKIHPRDSDSKVYGYGRNAIYTREMTNITEGECVDIGIRPDSNTTNYYTHSVATINGKQVHLVCTHFPPTPNNRSDLWETIAQRKKQMAKKIIDDMAAYQYVIITADFNTREFSLMPSEPFEYPDMAGTRYVYDCRYPCGFAAAGYSCASGGKGTVALRTDKTNGIVENVLINGSGTNYFKVDNILVKGMKISNVGMIDLSASENKINSNTQLSDHDIIYCTVSFD